jgi:hypothetical protein
MEVQLPPFLTSAINEEDKWSTSHPLSVTLPRDGELAPGALDRRSCAMIYRDEINQIKSVTLQKHYESVKSFQKRNYKRAFEFDNTHDRS